MECPCRYCEDRHTGCHASCERYAGYDAERKAISKARFEQLELDTLQVDRLLKRRKKWQMHHKK